MRWLENAGAHAKTPYLPRCVNAIGSRFVSLCHFISFPPPFFLFCAVRAVQSVWQCSTYATESRMLSRSPACMHACYTIPHDFVFFLLDLYLHFVLAFRAHACTGRLYYYCLRSWEWRRWERCSRFFEWNSWLNMDGLSDPKDVD